VLGVAVAAQVPNDRLFQVGPSYPSPTYGQALVGTAWHIRKTFHVLRCFLQRIASRGLNHARWPELTKNSREVGEAEGISKLIEEGKARELTREVDGPDTLS